MITSTQNSQVKKWRKLHTKKYRTEMSQFLIEGFHLLEEAYKSNWEIETVIVKEGTIVPDWVPKSDVVLVDARVFAEITETESPQGIAAVVQMKKRTPILNGYVLLVDRIQDPGNLGTIIRTADAAGFSSVFLGNGTVDVYNDKVIRATQGSIFHIPIETGSLVEIIAHLKQENYTILATALQDAVQYDTVKKQPKIALVIGNEGAGVSEEILKLADTTVKIPMYGQAESLNVSVAAGILMYEMRK